MVGSSKAMVFTCLPLELFLDFLKILLKILQTIFTSYVAEQIKSISKLYKRFPRFKMARQYCLLILESKPFILNIGSHQAAAFHQASLPSGAGIHAPNHIQGRSCWSGGPFFTPYYHIYSINRECNIVPITFFIIHCVCPLKYTVNSVINTIDHFYSKGPEVLRLSLSLYHVLLIFKVIILCVMITSHTVPLC